MQYTDPLIRLENDLWEVKKNIPENPTLRIKVPPYTSHPGKAYNIALATCELIEKVKLFEKSDWENSNYFQINSSDQDLAGKWCVKTWHDTSLNRKIRNLFTMTHAFTNPNVLVLEASKTDEVITDFIKIDSSLFPDLKFELSYKNLSFIERLQTTPFTDPFTILSRDYFQTIETNYISESIIRSDWHFQISEKGNLFIAPPTKNKQQSQNRELVKLYRDFIISEYGIKHLDYIQTTYGFNFDEIEKKGEPLLPDHVHKCNIGVNYLTLDDASELYQKLRLFSSGKIQEEKELLKLFSFRELKGLCHLLLDSDIILDDGIILKTLPKLIKEYLGENPPINLTQLEAKKFNALINILMVPKKYRDNIYTGRKVLHLPIFGYQTAPGNRNDWDPVANMSDLLQTFPEITSYDQTGESSKHWDSDFPKNWDNFFELLAHIISKKTNVGQFSTGKEKEFTTKAGMLIPGPLDSNGEEQWYYIKTVFGDGGDFYEEFESACENYTLNGKPLPFLQFYRSSTGNESYIDGRKYLLENFNPLGSPGTLTPQKQDDYRLPELRTRLNSLWYSYLLYAAKLETDNEVKEAIQTAFNFFCLSLIKLDKKTREDLYKEMPELKETKSIKQESFEAILKKAAGILGEAGKTAQDFIIGGHSLGGAASQMLFKHTVVDLLLIPQPGCKMTCYSLNGPGTDQFHKDELIKFLKAHEKMLTALGCTFDIFHRFQWGDEVPKAGESHLKGTIAKILRTKVQVFKVIDNISNSNNLPLIGNPIHGARIGQSKLDESYKLTELTSDELQEFDQSTFLSYKLSDIFGLYTRYSLEAARKMLSLMIWPFIYAYTQTPGVAPDFKRDEKGNFFLKYSANGK